MGHFVCGGLPLRHVCAGAAGLSIYRSARMMAGMAKAALPVAATRLLAYIDKLHAGCPVACGLLMQGRWAVVFAQMWLWLEPVHPIFEGCVAHLAQTPCLRIVHASISSL